MSSSTWRGHATAIDDASLALVAIGLLGGGIIVADLLSAVEV
jgi:hypothetical protein